MALALQTGIGVIYDFDVPMLKLVAKAHRWRQSITSFSSPRPVFRPAVIINVGGVANLTFIDANDIIAGHDIGPGNGLMDALMQRRTGLPYDEGGTLSELAALMRPSLPAHWKTRSLPRRPQIAGLGALPSWLIALTRLPLAGAARCAGSARAISPTVAALGGTGGGSGNRWRPAQQNPAGGDPGQPADGASLLNAADYGLQSDMIEAELIAFLSTASLQAAG